MKFKLIIFFILFLIVFLTLFNTKYFYSYTCFSCHNKVIFSNSLKSSHHSNLSCTDCHMKEGSLFILNLLLPTIIQKAQKYQLHHKIDNNNCTSANCHSYDSFEDIKKLKFNFPHKRHVNLKIFGDRLLCQNCHIDVAHLYKFRASKYICFLCHVITDPSKPESCFFCHSEIKKKINHPPKNCDRCHNIEKSDLTVNLHRCFFCHGELKTNFENKHELHFYHKKLSKIQCFDCHKRIVHFK